MFLNSQISNESVILYLCICINNVFQVLQLFYDNQLQEHAKKYRKQKFGNVDTEDSKGRYIELISKRNLKKNKGKYVQKKEQIDT